MSNGLKVIKKKVTEDKKSSEETETSKQGEKEDLGSSSKSPRRSWAEVVQRNLESGSNFRTLNSAETITIRAREDLSDMGLLNKQVGRLCDLSRKSIEKFSSDDVDEIELGKMDPSQACLNLDMCNVISNDSRAVFSELVGGRKKERKNDSFWEIQSKGLAEFEARKRVSLVERSQNLRFQGISDPDLTTRRDFLRGVR
ncbi:hypothetical protein V6N13_149753 [Hibiscus sabdariffa]